MKLYEIQVCVSVKFCWNAATVPYLRSMAVLMLQLQRSIAAVETIYDPQRKNICNIAQYKSLLTPGVKTTSLPSGKARIDFTRTFRVSPVCFRSINISCMSHHGDSWKLGYVAYTISISTKWGVSLGTLGGCLSLLWMVTARMGRLAFMGYEIGGRRQKRENPETGENTLMTLGAL